MTRSAGVGGSESGLPLGIDVTIVPPTPIGASNYDWRPSRKDNLEADRKLGRPFGRSQPIRSQRIRQQAATTPRRAGPRRPRSRFRRSIAWLLAVTRASANTVLAAGAPKHF